MNHSKVKDQRGWYILEAIETMMLNGDSYVYDDELFQQAINQRQKLTRNEYELDLAFLLQTGKLWRVGRRIYNRRTWTYEQATASHLASMLSCNDLPAPVLPDPLTVRGITLDDSQRSAVSMALSHRLSIILGGAGSGKTTLLQTIAKRCAGKGSRVLCAPTGKAACNLTERTGYQARTVHSALSTTPSSSPCTKTWGNLCTATSYTPPSPGRKEGDFGRRPGCLGASTPHPNPR